MKFSSFSSDILHIFYTLNLNLQLFLLSVRDATQNQLNTVLFRSSQG